MFMHIYIYIKGKQVEEEIYIITVLENSSERAIYVIVADFLL